ncbi:phosphoprotein phosphatase [Aureococcus anophagefferens]|nr:phosphoprotein phosphatase [Aureococcus anophagefferens]
MEPRGDADFVFDVQLCGVTSTTLLDKIDPDGSLIDHRLFRDARATVDGLYLKDLDVLGATSPRSRSSTTRPRLGFQPDNAIPIESWYDDEADDELDKLKALLDRLEHAPDVRPLARAVGDTTARAVGDTTMARDREPAWTLLKEPIVWSVALTSAILFVVLSVLWRNLGPIRVSLGKRQAVVIAVFAWVAAVGLCLLSVCDTCGRFEAYHMIGAGMFYVGGFGIMFATAAAWRTVYSLAGGMLTLFLWWADPFLGQLLAIATILLTCLSLQFDATYLGGPEVIPFTDT